MSHCVLMLMPLLSCVSCALTCTLLSPSKPTILTGTSHNKPLTPTTRPDLPWPIPVALSKCRSIASCNTMSITPHTVSTSKFPMVLHREHHEHQHQQRDGIRGKPSGSSSLPKLHKLELNNMFEGLLVEVRLLLWLSCTLLLIRQACATSSGSGRPFICPLCGTKNLLPCSVCRLSAYLYRSSLRTSRRRLRRLLLLLRLRLRLLQRPMLTRQR